MAGTALKRIAGYAWASPASMIGLALGMLSLVLGASWRVRAGVLEIAPAEQSSRKRRIPFDAVTLGHVVIGRSMRLLDELRAHELEHVRQFERWGVLLLLAYPLSSLAQAIRGRDPYRHNRFESQARERSSRLPPNVG